MKGLKIFLICLLLTSLNTQEIAEEDHVLVLTEANFDSAIAKYEMLLVKFYAPWCGHCKTMAPEFSNAAQQLKKTEGNKVTLAKVDATIEAKLAERYNIEGFPTLKWFQNTRESDYNGGRKAEDIIEWVVKKSGPSVVELKGHEDFQELLTKSQAVVVFYGKNEGAVWEAYHEASQVADNMVFTFITCPDVATKHNQVANDIVLHKTYDDNKNVYDSAKEHNLENIIEFIEENSMRLVSGFNDKSAEFIFGKSKTGLFLYRDNENEATKGLDAIMQEVAPEHKGKVYFIATGIKGELEEKLGEYIGITENMLPRLMIHDIKESEVLKYTLDKEITAENVRQFLLEYNNGTLNAEYKSEELPTEEESGKNVKKVVGKNFNEIVRNGDKDVLLKWHAPWCQHCQKLASVWENIASKFADHPSIVFAEIDATANEIPGETIEGYPTLRFYSHANKEHVDFSDSRSEFSILNFIKSQTLKHPVPEDIVFEPTEEDNQEEIEGGSEDSEEGDQEDLDENSSESETEQDL
jgi:protein disulfide-isomerase A1